MTEKVIEIAFVLIIMYVQVKFVYSEKATKFCEIFTLFLTVFTVVKSKVKIHKILWPSQNIWTLQTWGNKDAKNDQMKLHDELMLSRDYYKQEEYKAWIDLYTPAFLIQSKERLKTFHLDRECRHSLIDSFTLGSEKTA